MENKLQDLKKIYTYSSVPLSLKENGWNSLVSKLPSQRYLFMKMMLIRTCLFVSLFLIAAGSTVGVSQAAKPGSALYPVKVLSQKAITYVEQKIKTHPRKAESTPNLSPASSREPRATLTPTGESKGEKKSQSETKETRENSSNTNADESQNRQHFGNNSQKEVKGSHGESKKEENYRNNQKSDNGLDKRKQKEQKSKEEEPL